MLATIFSPKLLVLYTFIVSGSYIHFRGKVRHKFLRQFTDHSTFMAPFNSLVYLFSKTPSTPYIDVKEFPELQVFRDNWQVIEEEARRMYEVGHVRDSAAAKDDAAFQFFL